MNRRVERGLGLGGFVLIVVGVALIVTLLVTSYKGRKVDGIKPIPADACPCTTAEERQVMENRLAEVEAAAQENLKHASDASSSKPFSETQKEENVKEVSKAIGAEKVNKVAGTETTCATWTGDDKPACIRWALQVHENVHSAACQKYKGKENDWKKAGTQGDYSREDARAYQEEIDFLKSKLAKCPIANYPGAQNREEQLARRAGSMRRATIYAAALRA